MNKFWDNVLLEGLSYGSATKESFLADGNSYITRPVWNGVHFMVKDDYYILLKDGSIIRNPEEIFNMNDEDWMIVTVTAEAKAMIKFALGL